MKEPKETLVQSKFSAKAMKKIQKTQGDLKAQGKPASQGAAANHIVENAK